MRYWREPLDAERMTSSHGEVVIIADRCKGCGFCVEYCPLDILAMSDGFNRKGYHPPEVGLSGACVNCGLCEMICPEFAIFSVARPPEKPSASVLEEVAVEEVAP